MIDLNNTWCEATEKNREVLKTLISKCRPATKEEVSALLVKE